MAAIGRIRQHSGILIGLIGISIVGFLLMDATNSQFGVLKGSKDTVGKVNGQAVSYTDFMRKYEDNIKNMETQMSSRGQAVTDDQRNFMRNQTWNDMVSEIINKEVYQGLGINVTPEEMGELATGTHPHPYIVQNFTNPQTGQFDPRVVENVLRSLDQDDEGTEPGTRRKQWLNFENEMKKNQLSTKYANLITKALYGPSWMDEQAFIDQSKTVSFQYVQFPYTDIKDEDVKFEDSDLKKYMSSHAALFNQDEESRTIQFVTFDVVPSSADSAATIAWLEEKRAEFAQGKTASDDSFFVKLNSDITFDDVYYDKDKLNSPARDSFFAKPVKSIVGPYLDNGSFKLAKIVDRKTISDSVKVRDIQISFNGIKDQAGFAARLKMVDSLYKAIDSLKADFGAIAAQFSDDAASKMNGGNIGWVKLDTKEPQYNNLIFYRGVKGKTYKVPTNADNSYHILQVIEDKPSKVAVQVAYLSKAILPSPDTERDIYSAASKFASDNQTADAFKKSGEKAGMKNTDLKKDDYSVYGLGNARELVRWAFNAKKGDVSNIISADRKHIVALLEGIKQKGLPELDAFRESVKALYLQDKKAEMLTEKIKAAGAANIEAVASKFGKQVQAAEQVTFNNPAMGAAYEPNAVATALKTANGKLSAPVKGRSGVYVVQTISVTEPPKATDYSLYASQQRQKAQYKSRLADGAQRKLADVKDNRFDFF